MKESKKRLLAAEAVFTVRNMVGLDFTVAMRMARELNLTVLIHKMLKANSEGHITYSVPFDIAVNAVLTNTPEKYIKACFVATNQFDRNVEKILDEKGEFYDV